MPYFGVFGTKMIEINILALFWKEMSKNQLFEFQLYIAPSQAHKSTNQGHTSLPYN